jgi:hypothetical protein
LEHPDKDFKAGRSFTIRCDDAPIYLGGEGVTSDDGYLLPSATPATFNDSTDILYVAVAPADVDATLYVLWSGV